MSPRIDTAPWDHPKVDPEQQDKLREVEVIEVLLENEIERTLSGRLRNLLCDANIIIKSLKNDLWNPEVPE